MSSSRVRPTRAAKACVDVGDVPAPIDDDNQMHDRIERVFELASRADHVVEQLHVLDRCRQLPAKFVGPVEEVDLADAFDADTFDDDGAEGAAPPAQWRWSPWRSRPPAVGGHDFGALAAHRHRGRRARSSSASTRTLPAATWRGSEAACSTRVALAALVDPAPTCDRPRTGGSRLGTSR